MDKKVVALMYTLLESSDSDTELEILLSRKRKKRVKPRQCIKNYVEVALIYEPDCFKGTFRLQRDTFQQLLEILSPHLMIKSKSGVGRPPESPEKQLLIALCMLSNQEVFSFFQEHFGEVRCFKIYSLELYLSPEYIKWPKGDSAIKIIRGFEKRQGFPNTIGAIDGSHIPIAPPIKQQSSYCNRCKYHSIILQAVCDSRYLFTDVFAGYPGSVHDARVFRNSDLAKSIDENPLELFPNNSHILADSAYKNTTYIMTPYRNNGHLTRIQKQFNFKHSSTRVFIEQSFGLLKGRFRILKHVNIYRTDLIPTLIVACCVLHNICMMKGDEIEPDIDKNDDMPKLPYSGKDNTGLDKRNAIARLLCKVTT